jgi:hypothetical protein
MKNLGQNKNSAFSPLSRLTPESAMVQLSTSFAYVTSHEDHDLFRLLHQSEYAGTLGHPPANTPKFFSTELLAGCGTIRSGSKRRRMPSALTGGARMDRNGLAEALG